MSARKLGRLAGLVFVLAIAFGGAVGVVGSGAKHDVATVSAADADAVQMRTLEIIWD